jgi:hypothetical protein
MRAAVRSLGQLLHVLLRGLGQRNPARRAGAGISHVDAIERERVSMDVEPERRVDPLHERHRAGEQRRHARQAMLALGPVPVAAAELAAELTVLAFCEACPPKTSG